MLGINGLIFNLIKTILDLYRSDRNPVRPITSDIDLSRMLAGFCLKWLGNAYIWFNLLNWSVSNVH